MRSVLQDWVMELPLREQGAMLTAIRSCDLAPKMPIIASGEDSAERGLVAYLRCIVMNAADPREIGVPGGFMQSDPPSQWKPSQFGHYPLHWVSHIMHAFEVVGFRHPDANVAGVALSIYQRFVHSLHLFPETKEQMIERLSEDRFVTGTVVS